LVDPIDPPRRWGLGRVDDLVGLDVGDARIGRQGCSPVGGKPGGEALEGMLVDEGDVPAVRPSEVPGGGRNERPLRVSLGRSADGVRLEDDDVGTRSGILCRAGLTCGQRCGHGETHEQRGGKKRSHHSCLLGEVF
jgi:hypothetical protein